MSAEEAPTPPDSMAPLRPTDPLRAALRESEEAYRRLFDLSPLPMWVRDAVNLRFLDVNRAALATYGYSREEFLAMTVEDIRPPEERARFLSFLSKRGPENTESHSGRWIHLRKDGTALTVEAWSLDLLFHGRPARLVVARDLTQQLRAEEEARCSRERFQLIASATSDAIWDWDFTNDTLWWGGTFYTLFGRRADAFPGTLRAWAEAIHPEDRERVIQSLQTARAEAKETWCEEYRFMRGDGSYAEVIDRGRIVCDPDGRPHRMVGGMTDITERRRLQSQYMSARRLDSIGTLAGGIAHDLNNMLAPIRLAVDLLRTTAGDTSHRYLDTIETSASRSADLVRQVLTFARGAGGQRSTVAPHPLLLEAARFARETFPQSFEIQVQAAPDLWTVRANPTQLGQILLNLSLNARDAMPKGGRMVFAADNTRVDEATAAANLGAHPGPHVVFSVSDTGMGIPATHLDRVFEPFFTTKEVGQGTGLGLATVHAVAREHEGFVTVESTPGAGSTFRVYLPVSPDLAALIEGEDGTAKQGLPSNGKTVLLIDDEPALRDLTRHILEHAGYSVLTAADGAEGVALFAQHRSAVAVVVTDLAMPIMDGATTIVALHRIEKDLPIIVISGYDPSSRLTRGMHPHLRHFLSKPYAPADLLAAIKDCID